MAQRDSIHDAVKNALIKDHWTILREQLYLEYGDVLGVVDLEAEKPLEAEKEGRLIAVEVKSFSAPSTSHTFGQAMGQYLLYRSLIKWTGRSHAVYMAISEETYLDTFQRLGIRQLVNEHQIFLLVVRISTGEVIVWIEPPLALD